MRLNSVKNLKQFIPKDALTTIKPKIKSDEEEIFFALRKMIIKKLHETETGRADLKHQVIKKLNSIGTFSSLINCLNDYISQYNSCSFFSCYKWSAGKLNETLKNLCNISNTVFKEVSQKNQSQHLQGLFLQSYPELDLNIDKCLSQALAQTQARSDIMRYGDVSTDVQLSPASIEEARCYKDFAQRFENLNKELEDKEYKGFSESKGGQALLNLRLKQIKLIHESISQKEISYKLDENYDFLNTFEEIFSCASNNERQLHKALFHARFAMSNFSRNYFDNFSRKSSFIEAVGKYVAEQVDLDDNGKKWILDKVLLMAESPDKSEDILRRMNTNNEKVFGFR